MSLKKSLGVVASLSAVALALYGVGCGSSSGGHQHNGEGGAGSGGSSGSGGTTGTGGTMGSGGTTGSGGSAGISPFEAGSEGGGMCSPGPVTGVTFGTNPDAITAGGCTTTMIQDIVNACFGGNPDAGASDCKNLLVGSYLNCYQKCLFSPWSTTLNSYMASPWGGIIYSDPNASFVNFGGCILAATKGTSLATAGATCAKDYESGLECELQACTASCTIPAPPSGTLCSSDPSCKAGLDALNGCLGMASTGDCAKYNTAVMTDCASLTADSGLLVDCANDIGVLTGQIDAGMPDFTKAITQYFDILCTGGVPDGG